MNPGAMAACRALSGAVELSDVIAFLAFIAAAVALWHSTRQWQEDQRDRLLASVVGQITTLRTMQQRIDAALRRSERDPQPVQALTSDHIAGLRNMRERSNDLVAACERLHKLAVQIGGWPLMRQVHGWRHQVGLDEVNLRLGVMSTDELIGWIDEIRTKWGEGTFTR